MIKLGMDTFSKIPVFVDWNIGIFSVVIMALFFPRWIMIGLE
jgi:hypothetical protein